MLAPVLLLLASALVVTPEADVVPPRIGIPPTSDHPGVIATSADGFIVGYRASPEPFFARLSGDGALEPDVMLPGEVGNALAIASDGERFLALVQPFGGNAKVLLLGTDGAVIHESRQIPAVRDEAPRSVVWSGSDYVVAWLDEATIYAARFTRDGLPIGGPYEVMQGAMRSPHLARMGEEVVLAALAGSGDTGEIRLFRMGTASAAPFEVLHPRRPVIVDFVSSDGGLLLLLRESIPGTSVLNLYRLEKGKPPRITASFEDAAWTTPALLQLPDAILIYGTYGHQIFVQRLAWDGAPVVERRAILDTRFNYVPFLRAAANAKVIVFAWGEPLLDPLDGLDAVTATVDLALTNARADGFPDGVLLAPGASERRNPRVAKAGESTLVIWQEHFEGRRWIAGAINGREIVVADVAFGDPDVATDGERFLVTWIDGMAAQARFIDSAGAMSDVITVAEDKAHRPRITGNAGGFLVVWEDPDRNFFASRLGSFVFGRRIDGSGRFLDPERVQLAGPSASDPGVATDGQRFLVAWTAGSICHRAHCATETTLNLSGRIFDATLQPVSSEFVISEEARTNEMEPNVASSGDSWLVAWSAERRVYDPSLMTVTFLSDAGHAAISTGGFVTATHRPVPDFGTLRGDPALSWNGRHYFLVFEDLNDLVGVRITKNGERTDIADVSVAEGGSEPALAGSLLVYQRVAAERGLGAAPQVFTRDLFDRSTVRRRAVSR